MEKFGEKKLGVVRQVCSICQRPIEPDPNGWGGGHNAWPVNDGRCCGDCNSLVVLPARFQQMFEGMKAKEKSQSQSNPQSEEEKH